MEPPIKKTNVYLRLKLDARKMVSENYFGTCLIIYPNPLLFLDISTASQENLDLSLIGNVY